MSGQHFVQNAESRQCMRDVCGLLVVVQVVVVSSSCRCLGIYAVTLSRFCGCCCFWRDEFSSRQYEKELDKLRRKNTELPVHECRDSRVHLDPQVTLRF